MNVTVSAAGGKCSLMPLHDRLIIITSALKKYNEGEHHFIILLIIFITSFYCCGVLFIVVVVEVSYTHIARWRRVRYSLPS